jgi:hypothetical protein
MLAFTVSLVGFDDKGRSTYQKSVEAKIDTQYSTLRRGASEEFPLLLRVSQKGFYLVTFSVKLSDEELRVHERTAHDATARGADAPIVWSESTYVAVR